MARIEGAARADMFTMDPDQIVVPSEGPLFDERSTWPVNEDLVANIKYHGQIQPIIVRKNGDKIEVVAGRQRLKAIREINRRAKERGEKTVMKVKCCLVHGSNAEHYGLMISENEIRRDDDTLTKAAKAKRLSQHGMTARDIGIIFGVQARAVEEWLSLTDVAPEVQKAIQEGEIAAGVGVALAELPREKQAAKLAEMQAAGEGKPVTVDQARREVRAGKRPDAPPKPKRKCDREVRSRLGLLCDRPINEITDREQHWAEALEWVLGELDELGEADVPEARQARPPRKGQPLPPTGRPATIPPPRPNGRAAEAHI